MIVSFSFSTLFLQPISLQQQFQYRYVTSSSTDYSVSVSLIQQISATSKFAQL